MHRCSYCLCRVCNPIRCPRGRYHCLPCHHGIVLDCPFFIHKRMTKVFRIKKLSPAIRQAELEKLRDTINLILGDGQIDLGQPKSIREALEQENQRHKRALREIVNNSKYRE